MQLKKQKRGGETLRYINGNSQLLTQPPINQPTSSSPAFSDYVILRESAQPLTHRGET